MSITDSLLAGILVIESACFTVIWLWLRGRR